MPETIASEENPIQVQSTGGIMTITINREARRNAVNDEMFGQIGAALTWAGQTGIRIIVLTGAGTKAFCAGADLAKGSGSFAFDFSQVGVPFVKLLKQARDLTIPLIARINGHCMAGGMGLLGMCDMAVATDHALFGLPEVKVGVFPMQVLSVLQRLIPPRKLYELALTGEPVGAAEALELGLINYAVTDSELDAKIAWLCERILNKSPTAIRRGKYAMRHIESMSFDEAIGFMEGQIGLLSMTEDAAEGRKAFIEKRPPSWTGR